MSQQHNYYKDNDTKRTISLESLSESFFSADENIDPFCFVWAFNSFPCQRIWKVASHRQHFCWFSLKFQGPQNILLHEYLNMQYIKINIWARIYQASQSAILVLSAENSWNVLLLSNLSIKANYQIS